MLYTIPAIAPTHNQVLESYQAEFSARVARGELRPLVFPNFLFGVFTTVAYLCIPHTNRPWLYKARWLALAAVMAIDFKNIRETSSRNTASAFGAGLMSMYSSVLAWTWLVWCRPQFEAKRVQRRRKKPAGEPLGNGSVGSVDRGARSMSTAVSPAYDSVQSRHHQNGSAREGKASRDTDGEVSDYEYYWQSYPTTSLRDRVDWVLDLMFNFRGQGWNWSIPTNPPFPDYVKVSLGEKVDAKSSGTTSSVGMQRFTSRSDLFWRNLRSFLAGYLVLDILKVVLMKDPYFIYGPNEYALPRYLSWMDPLTLKAWREIQSLVAVCTALGTIFVTAPLILHCLLGPKYLGVKGEIWQYPTHWGNGSKILDKGLGALWNGVWHQAFRQIFLAPTQFLVSKGVIKPRSASAKLVGLLFAFFISGLLHASGSITEFPATQPLDAMSFFLLQGVGIAVQTTSCQLFKPQLEKLPRGLRRAGNFAFVFVWLFWTSPMLIGDFARGGIWLWEPVPMSPLRGLGLGQEGDGFWCLNPIGWYSGKHWWESGIAV